MKNYSSLLIVVILLISCKGKNGNVQNSQKDTTAIVTCADYKNDIVNIPVYSDCKNYNNNVSFIAQNISFIPIDATPLLNDFHVTGIEICDEYLFLSGMQFIYQYDKNGTFIKEIGKRGNGPEEYVNIAPINLDRSNKLIYAHDTNRSRVLVYNYNGTFIKAFPLSGDKNIQLIDPGIIALRPSTTDRIRSGCPLIEFIDNNGKEIQRYLSNHYPISKAKMEHWGPDTSPMWKNRDNYYYLEYGTDTIFRISGTLPMIPEQVLTGKLKLSLEEHYHKNTKGKLFIATPITRYNSGVFGSNGFMIFRLSNGQEDFFMVYNKHTGMLQRTFHEDAPLLLLGPNKKEGPRKHDYFIDDMVSGLPLNLLYQSEGKAVSLIPASDICEKKAEILDFIDKHPSEESKRIRPIIQKMTEDDNSLIAVITLK